MISNHSFVNQQGNQIYSDGIQLVNQQESLHQNLQENQQQSQLVNQQESQRVNLNDFGVTQLGNQSHFYVNQQEIQKHSGENHFCVNHFCVNQLVKLNHCDANQQVNPLGTLLETLTCFFLIEETRSHYQEFLGLIHYLLDFLQDCLRVILTLCSSDCHLHFLDYHLHFLDCHLHFLDCLSHFWDLPIHGHFLKC